MLRKWAGSPDFEKSLVESYTIIYQVKSKSQGSVLANIMVQQRNQGARWVVTRFGSVNSAKALESTRQRMIQAVGPRKDLYVVMAPYLYRSYLTSGTGKSMQMLEVQAVGSGKSRMQPVFGDEVFRILRHEADSLGLGCHDNPEECKKVKQTNLGIIN